GRAALLTQVAGLSEEQMIPCIEATAITAASKAIQDTQEALGASAKEIGNAAGNGQDEEEEDEE
ncbi:hypothetical protein ACJX0J_040424, partial [Zea mays]